MHMKKQNHRNILVKKDVKITVIMGVYNPEQPEYLFQAGALHHWTDLSGLGNADL